MMMDLPESRRLAERACEPSRARSTLVAWLPQPCLASLISDFVTPDDRPCIPDGQWCPRPNPRSQFGVAW